MEIKHRGMDAAIASAGQNRDDQLDPGNLSSGATPIHVYSTVSGRSVNGTDNQAVRSGDRQRETIKRIDRATDGYTTRRIDRGQTGRDNQAN